MFPIAHGADWKVVASGELVLGQAKTTAEIADHNDTTTACELLWSKRRIVRICGGRCLDLVF